MKPWCWFVLCLVGIAQAEPLTPDLLAPHVRIDTETELFNAFALDRPELAKVKSAVDAGDFAAAKRALLDYYRQRRAPIWFENWWNRPQSNTNATPTALVPNAERILAHQFAAGGLSVRFDGPIDWHYLPNPQASSSDFQTPLVLYINRFTWWRDTLGPAYWATGDERYAREWADQVTDWTTRNPAVTEFNEQLTPSPWRKLTVAHSTPMWISGLNYFLQSPSVTPETLATYFKTIIQKTRFTIRNPDAVNRRLVQLEAVHAVATYFPELRDASRWREWSLDELERFISDQIYPDGALKELAPGYQAIALVSLRNIVSLAVANKAPIRYAIRDTLARECDYLAAIMLPDGTLPAFADTWGPAFVAPELRRTLELYPTEKGKRPVEELSYIVSHGLEGVAPRFSSTAEPWAGIYVMRGLGRTNVNFKTTVTPLVRNDEPGTGWHYPDLAMAFRTGPYGTEHQHEDKLSFVLYGFGARLLDEMGIYSTGSSGWRESYFAATVSHNTLTVDGQGQNRRSQPATWTTQQPLENNWVSNDAFDFVSGVYEDGWGPRNDRSVSQRREIFFAKPDYWIVHDLMTGTGTHTYESCFHMQPANSARIHDLTRVSYTDNIKRPNLVIYPVDADAEIEIRRGWIVNPTDPASPRQGWFSAGLQKVEPAPCTVLRRRATASDVLASILLPAMPSDTADILAQRLAVTDETGRVLPRTEVCALQITTRSGVDLFINDLRFPDLLETQVRPKSIQTTQFGKLQFSGKLLFIRYAAQHTPQVLRYTGKTAPVDADGKELTADKR